MTSTEQRKALQNQIWKIANDVDYIGWNSYVSATIAFLERDLDKLKQAKIESDATPQPEGLILRDQNGNVVERPWPPNGFVIDRLLACFNSSYFDAYRNGC